MNSMISTRDRIKNVFLQLSEENQYDKVSVTSVCQSAGVNRSTFYFYFESIDLLLDEIEHDFVSNIAFVDCFTNEAAIYKQVLRYVTYVKNNRAVFFTLIKNGRLISAFLSKSAAKSSQFSQRRLPGRSRQDTGSLLSAYTTVGSIALLEQWLVDCPQYPPEKVARIICRLALTAARQQME